MARRHVLVPRPSVPQGQPCQFLPKCKHLSLPAPTYGRTLGYGRPAPPKPPPLQRQNKGHACRGPHSWEGNAKRNEKSGDGEK